MGQEEPPAMSVDTALEIRRQVEFYFSDSNLPKDCYLLGLVSADPEGFVDLAILCTFTRMRRLLGEALSVPALSQHSRHSGHSGEGTRGRNASGGGGASAASASAGQQARQVEAVAGALQESEVLTLSADGKRVRRTEPLRPASDIALEVNARSLLVAPFPRDATLDTIRDFFERCVGLPVNSVRTQYHLLSGDFNGNAFVEFASPEEAAKVAGMELEYEGAPLKMEPKSEYVERVKKPTEGAADALSARSLLVSPFSMTAKLSDVCGFFIQVTGKYINRAYPRRQPTGEFTGEVLVEFCSPLEAGRVAAMQLVFEGVLLKMEHSRQAAHSVVMEAKNARKAADAAQQGSPPIHTVAGHTRQTPPQQHTPRQQQQGQRRPFGTPLAAAGRPGQQQQPFGGWQQGPRAPFAQRGRGAVRGGRGFPGQGGGGRFGQRPQGWQPGFQQVPQQRMGQQAQQPQQRPQQQATAQSAPPGQQRQLPSPPPAQPHLPPPQLQPTLQRQQQHQQQQQQQESPVAQAPQRSASSYLWQSAKRPLSIPSSATGVAQTALPPDTPQATKGGQADARDVVWEQPQVKRQRID